MPIIRILYCSRCSVSGAMMCFCFCTGLCLTVSQESIEFASMHDLKIPLWKKCQLYFRVIHNSYSKILPNIYSKYYQERWSKLSFTPLHLTRQRTIFTHTVYYCLHQCLLYMNGLYIYFFHKNHYRYTFCCWTFKYILIW